MLRNNILISEPEQIAPGILVFENVLHSCQDFIDELENKYSDLRLSGQVYSPHKKGKLLSSEIRSVGVYPISGGYEYPYEWWQVSQLLYSYGAYYSYYYGIHFKNMEGVQILHYKAGKDFYKKHWDHGVGKDSRIFSSVLYLNDVEEGGETEFPLFGKKIEPREGRLVMFPASFSYIHEALAPISNDKWAAVTWFQEGIAEHRHEIDDTISSKEE